MLILRQKMRAKPDKSDELMAALAEIIAGARATPGVISLDIASVMLEPDSFIATAVYEDAAAPERQVTSRGAQGDGDAADSLAAPSTNDLRRVARPGARLLAAADFDATHPVRGEAPCAKLQSARSPDRLRRGILNLNAESVARRPVRRRRDALLAPGLDELIVCVWTSATAPTSRSASTPPGTRRTTTPTHTPTSQRRAATAAEEAVTGTSRADSGRRPPRWIPAPTWPVRHLDFPSFHGPTPHTSLSGTLIIGELQVPRGWSWEEFVPCRARRSPATSIA